MPTQKQLEKMLALKAWVNERVVDNTNEFKPFLAKFKDSVPVHVVPHTMILWGDVFEALAVLLITPEDVQNKDEIEYFKDNFNHGIMFSYVYNLTDDMLSEYGSIGFEIVNNRMKRI